MHCSIQSGTLFHCFSIKCRITCDEHDVNKIRNFAGNSRSRVILPRKTSTHSRINWIMTPSLVHSYSCKTFIFRIPRVLFIRFPTAVSTKLCVLFSFQQLPEKVFFKTFDLFSLSVTLICKLLMCNMRIWNLESGNQKNTCYLSQFVSGFTLVLFSCLDRGEYFKPSRTFSANGRTHFSGHCVSSISPRQERKKVYSIFP